MNCPHCQQGLPADFSLEICPHCGKDLPSEHLQGGTPPPAARARWPLFFGVLFAPAICCFIGFALNLGFLAVLSGLSGGLISGLVCTRIVIGRLAASGRRSALLTFGIGVLLCSLSYFLSGLGCSIGSSVTGHTL
jgi:hypothetical protein